MKEIELSQGRVALVDDEDYEWLNQWKWYCCTYSNGAVYAKRSVRISPTKTKTICMHRLILGINDGERWHGDHEDGNGLNNQRYNIRKCTVAQNGMNRRLGKNSKSGYKGVSWNSATNKWTASYMIGGKTKTIGNFKNKEDAALAYNKAVLAAFGEFARINKIAVEPIIIGSTATT